MRRPGLVLLLVLTTAVSPLPAQRLDDTRVAVQQASTEITPAQRTTALAAASQTSASTGAMVTGGIIGGVLGAFAGAAVGISAENCQGSGDSFCGVAGGVLGGLIGEAIGVPVGVNWVSNGRNKLERTIPTSIAMSVVCLLGGFATGGASVLMIAPMQIYTSIRTERTGKSGFLIW